MPLISNAHIVSNLSAVASYPTDAAKTIKVSFGEQKFGFDTNKQNLKEALINQDINFAEEDLVEPSLETVLNPGVTEVSIKKAMPVAIIDEGRTIVGRSAYLSVPDILKDLSINLYANDEVKVASPLEGINMELKIYIDRANIVNLQVDGKLREVHTRLGAMADLLYSENIILGPEDRVEPSLDTKITNGLNVKVIRVLRSEGSEIVDIPFDIQYKDDYNMLEGETRVEKAGVVGQKEVSLKRMVENGVEVQKEILSERIIRESSPQIIIRGQRPKFTYASGSFSDLINDAALKYGVDAGRLQRLMMCESGGNPNSVGGGGRFHGLFQYMSSTWASTSNGAGFAGVSIYDARAQIYATAWKISVSGYGAWPVCGRR